MNTDRKHETNVRAQRFGARLIPSKARELVAAFIWIAYASSTFFLIQYDRMRTWNPTLEAWTRTKLNGTAEAPEQYRVGMALLMRFLQDHAHLAMARSLPMLESISYMGTLVLLYFLLRYGLAVSHARVPRLLAVGIFFAIVQFPVLWIFPWERLETVPTALYLAATVLLIVRSERMPTWVTASLVVLFSLGQALLRADVPVVLGAALVVAAVLAIPLGRGRVALALLGALSAAVGGATQLYLQRVVFPNAHYSPTTPKIQLLTNLNFHYAPFNLPILLTALLPAASILLLLRRERIPLEPADKLVMLICVLYLPVWFVAGIIGEVRIYVPFLFLASPALAKMWALFLRPGATTPGE